MRALAGAGVGMSAMRGVWELKSWFSCLGWFARAKNDGVFTHTSRRTSVYYEDYETTMAILLIGRLY